MRKPVFIPRDELPYLGALVYFLDKGPYIVESVCYPWMLYIRLAASADPKPTYPTYGYTYISDVRKCTADSSI